MNVTSSHVRRSTPTLSATLSERLAGQVRDRPVRSVVQAALAGYAFHYFPLRSALNTALRLTVPALFTYGLMKLAQRLPITEPRE